MSPPDVKTPREPHALAFTIPEMSSDEYDALVAEARAAANGEIPHKTGRKEASGRKARGRKPIIDVTPITISTNHGDLFEVTP